MLIYKILDMPFNVFKKDMEYINSLLEIGKEPNLTDDELAAVSNYSMKRSAGFTPMLR